MKPSFFARYGIYIMAVALFLLPFAAIGAINAKKQSKNDVKNWIPPEYDETKIFTAFRQLYKGGDEFILVSWDGCTRENQRLKDLALKVGPQIEIIYQHQETGVRADDVELAKLDVEEKYEAEFKADLVKQATNADANAEVPKLVYSDEIKRDGNIYIYIYRSAEDMGDDPKEPNRNRAYATIAIKPTTYFSKVSTGPRVMEQIIRSNGGKMSREVVADKLAGSLFGPGFKTKDPRTGKWEAVHKSKLETIVDAEGKETTKLVHRDPDTNEVLPDNKVVAVPVDERQTCMLVNLSETGIAKKKEAIDELRNIAINQCKIPADSLRIGGPAVDNVAIDDAGQKSLNTLAGLAVVIGAIVSWFSLRSYKLVIIVLASGIYASVLSLSIVYWTSAPVDAILFTMPSLVYVATTSGAIHLSNYYRDVILEGGSPSGAGGKALHHAALPLGLATGTTAVGLATLCITELVPIYNFGLYSAIGVVVSALLLIFLIPAALELWQPPIHRPKTLHIDHNETHSYIDPRSFWWRAGQWVLRHGKVVSICCLLFMGLAGYGLFYGETSVQLLRLLSPRERVIADYGFLEEKIGPLVPMEVVVRIPIKNDVAADGNSVSAGNKAEVAATEMNFYQRLQLIDSIRQRVETINEVGSTMSTLTFMESLETMGSSLPSSIHDRVLNSRLLKHRDEFLASDYLREEVHKDGKVYSRRPGGHLRELRDIEANPELDGKTFEVWRISARVSALKNVDYALFIANLKENVEPEVDDFLLYVKSTQKNATETTVSAAEMNLGLTNLLPPWVDRSNTRLGIHTQYTGVVPLVYKAQHSLMDGLVWGFLTDFALIVIVMMIACRDWSAGIVLLLPSAFPAIVVFGTMGWIHHFLKSRGIGNLYIDIGYVMAPSVALGVTVDDVVHFMLWFRKGISEGMNRKESVELAFKGCARAMYQSWGVIGIGLSIFALSAFMPTRNFGIMMISMLTVALAGNLLMLPAILVGPGGAVFAWGVLRKENRKRRKAGLHEIHSHPESFEPTIEGDDEEVPVPAKQIQIATEIVPEVAATATEHDYDDDIVTVRLPNVTSADPAQSTPAAPHAAKSDSLRRTFRRK